MKILTLLTAFVCTASFLFAQELTVKYDITMSSDNPQVQAQLGMMAGSTLSIFAKGNQSRTVMNMGNGLMKTTTVIDSDKKKGIMLMDGMLGKKAAPFDLENFEDKAESDSSDMKIELKDETKEILGYTCKKAVMYTDNGGEFIYWYTEELEAPNKNSLGKYANKKVPGFPLAYTINMQKMTMSFMASTVKEKVEEKEGMFQLNVPEGYTETSFDELKKMGQ